MSEESLAHFGILGQKWGVRRYQNEDRTYTEEGKLRYAKNHDGEDRREWKAKDAKDLSDKELRDRISRLQLEKTYTQLFETPKVQNNGFQKPQKQKNKGGGIMKKIFFATAVTALSTVVQGKYQDFFKAKADKFIDSVKRNRTAAKNAAEVAKTIKDTAVASNAWDAYKKMMKHSDEDGLSFLDVKVDDLYLEHHGIKGQKWGVRRYQNEDGSLTEEGIERYWHKTVKNTGKQIRKQKRILHKNGVSQYNSAYDEQKFSAKDRKKLADARQKIAENQRKLSDLSYYESELIEKKYEQKIKDETNTDWIDPKYRKFSSKTEKAKAEVAYLERLSKEPLPEDTERWNREVGHIANAVTGLSLDGYEGVPKSERQKAEYDRVDDEAIFDTYRNWIPKYESTNEWKALQGERKRLKDQYRIEEKRKAYFNADEYGPDVKEAYEQYWNALQQYNKQNQVIKAKEDSITQKFKQKLLKNLCLDLGYEPTAKNMELLEPWCWYD